VDARGGFAPQIIIRGVSVSARFPYLLKLPHKRLELFQLGWRASDEGNKGGRPVIVTTQPWQVFAWIAARHRELYIRVASVKLRNPWMGPPGFEFPGFSLPGSPAHWQRGLSPGRHPSQARLRPLRRR